MKRILTFTFLNFFILICGPVLAETPVDGGPGVKQLQSPGEYRHEEPRKHTPHAPASHMRAFFANYDKDGIVLSWTTFDHGNGRFEVERSTDGIAFKHTGTVVASGTPATQESYKFTDNAAKKITANADLYYRLKEVDASGNALYSNVLVVRLYRTRALGMISVMPHPVSNNITVNVALNENAFMVLKVADTSGVEVLRRSGKGTRGLNNINLEGTNLLHQGIYFLEVIINSNERMMMKLVKE